jgi:hypothetical protein
VTFSSLSAVPSYRVYTEGDVAINCHAPSAPRRGGIGDTEDQVNTKYIRKLATVTATAALTLQLFAGTSSAAVPNAVHDTVAVPEFYSDGTNVAFFATYSLTDSGTLAKLFGDFTVSGASAVTISATKNGGTVARACGLVSANLYECVFKTVRTGDVIEVKLLVTPSLYAAGATASVATSFSTTGATGSDGGNTSHGDTWDSNASSAYDNDPDYAGGYGAGKLSTRGSLSSTGNPQIAALDKIPSNVGATIRDDITCAASAFPCIDINVDGGTTFANAFIVQVQYYANGAPTSFVHTYVNSAGQEQTQTINECAKRNPSYPCFTFSNKNNTVTIYLLHNGQLRRTS